MVDFVARMGLWGAGRESNCEIAEVDQSRVLDSTRASVLLDVRRYDLGLAHLGTEGSQ